MTDELSRYVAEHREDLHYALLHGDKWVRTVVIAALLASGDAEAEVARIELERAQQDNRA